MGGFGIWIPGPGGGGSGGMARVVDLTRTTTQSPAAHNTWTMVEFDSELTDPNDWHSNVTNPSRATAPTDGEFMVTITLGLVSIPSSFQIALGVHVNGVRVDPPLSISTGATLAHLLQLTHPVELSAGDYVEAGIYHNSAANRTIRADSRMTIYSLG